MKTLKEILNQLPKDWRGIKLKDFQKLTNIIIKETGEGVEDLFAGIDNTLKVISVLTDTSKEELESLPINDVTTLCKKIEFMSELPKPNKKSCIKWKTAEEISYGNFVLYQQLEKEFFQNLHIIIAAFSKEKITPEEVEELNFEDMYTAFFLQSRVVERLLNPTNFYFKVRQTNQQITEWILTKIFRQKLKKN